MNRMKRNCALLLTIVLILGMAFQPGIGGVFAEHTEKTGQITEPVAETATESAAEPTTEPATEPTEADTLPNEEPSKKPDEHTSDICPECGEAAGHAKTCSQYTVENIVFWQAVKKP